MGNLRIELLYKPNFDLFGGVGQDLENTWLTEHTLYREDVVDSVV